MFNARSRNADGESIISVSRKTQGSFIGIHTIMYWPDHCPVELVLTPKLLKTYNALDSMNNT